MTSPESLVECFIEDYFRWNIEASDQINKLQIAEDSALLSLGIKDPIHLEQITNISKYVEVKKKYADERAKMFAKINKNYQKLIKTYCRPKYKSLNVAFGSDSSHDPDNEIIVSIKTVDGKSIIKTKKTSDFINFVSDYEFHLIYENKRWYLEQIYYVSDEGRYESL